MLTENIVRQIILEEINIALNEVLEEKKKKKKKARRDSCYRSAKRKFKVFPSRYAGAYIARCRDKK